MAPDGSDQAKGNDSQTNEPTEPAAKDPSQHEINTNGAEHKADHRLNEEIVLLQRQSPPGPPCSTMIVCAPSSPSTMRMCNRMPARVSDGKDGLSVTRRATG